MAAAMAERSFDEAEQIRSQYLLQGQPPLEELLFQSPLQGPNAVERMFCRLKDYRRIATRYDKLATNFLGAICLAAAVTWWL